MHAKQANAKICVCLFFYIDELSRRYFTMPCQCDQFDPEGYVREGSEFRHGMAIGLAFFYKRMAA